VRGGGGGDDDVEGNAAVAVAVVAGVVAAADFVCERGRAHCEGLASAAVPVQESSASMATVTAAPSPPPAKDV